MAHGTPPFVMKCCPCPTALKPEPTTARYSSPDPCQMLVVKIARSKSLVSHFRRIVSFNNLCRAAIHIKTFDVHNQTFIDNKAF